MTIIYNLLNFPAGVVPVSTVTADDEEELRQYKGNFQDCFDDLFKKVINMLGKFDSYNSFCLYFYFLTFFL